MYVVFFQNKKMNIDIFLISFTTLLFCNELLWVANGKMILNMIVKDEAKVIERCLTSTLPLIDAWVIVDTGSTDNTPDLIRHFFKRHKVPGHLYSSPWVNFEHNRNEALKWATLFISSFSSSKDVEFKKNKMQSSLSDYILFIDADEFFVLDPGFTWPNPMNQDLYNVMTRYGSLRYHRVQLISTQITDWQWQGVVHETIHSPTYKTSGFIEHIHVHVTSEGASWNDPNKYLKHAQLFEKELIRNPRDTRSQFYLAQSYRDANQPRLAIQHYERRIIMGGWDEEIFNSMLNIAKLQEEMFNDGDDASVFLSSYVRAFRYRPSRIEPLFFIANYYMDVHNYVIACNVLQQLIHAPPTTDILFVDIWIYETARWDKWNAAPCNLLLIE